MNQTQSAPWAGRVYPYGIVAVVIAVLAVLFLMNSRSEDVVAKVNGKPITQEQLLQRIPLATRQSVLESLIFDQLVQQEAEAQGVKASDSEVEKQIAELKEDFGDPEGFDQALAAQGLDQERLYEQIRLDLLVRKLLEPSIEVTEENLQQYFTANKAQYDQAEEVKASHILVATKEEAEEVLQQLKDGADFAQLAEERSIDPGSKQRGGDLGWFGRGRMNQPFENAAFSQPIGEPGEVVESPNGFHVILVTDKKEAKPAVYEEVKDKVREDYMLAQMQEMAPEWIRSLQEKANIENYLETAVS